MERFYPRKFYIICISSTREVIRKKILNFFNNVFNIFQRKLLGKQKTSTANKFNHFYLIIDSDMQLR